MDIDTLRAAQNGLQLLAEHLATMTMSAVNFKTGSAANLKRLGKSEPGPDRRRCLRLVGDRPGRWLPSTKS